jgi:tripartite-type tricarboxylate transporter receptor subunit TctC
VQKLHHAYLKALADQEWTKKMAAQGIQLLSDAHYAPAAFAQHTAAEVEKWRKVVSSAKIQLD